VHELPTTASEVTPHMLLEEVYPLAAYYQDTCRKGSSCAGGWIAAETAGIREAAAG